VSLPLTLSDLNEIDRQYWPSLCHIKNSMSDSQEEITLNQLELPFTTTDSSGVEVKLSSRHRLVNLDNYLAYLQSALHYRLVIIKCCNLLQYYLII
jgi:hypothetical protein